MSSFWHSLGGLGFARFAFELIRQEHDNDIFFDIIVHTPMTGFSTGFDATALGEVESNVPLNILFVYMGVIPILMRVRRFLTLLEGSIFFKT